MYTENVKICKFLKINIFNYWVINLKYTINLLIFQFDMAANDRVANYLQNKTTINNVAYKLAKLFKFDTMYVLFAQSMPVRSPRSMP